MIKGTMQQEDTIFVNIYASNIGATKYIKQTQREKLTVIQ